VHLSEKDRFKIEGLLEGKKDVEEISIILRRNRSTIYRKIERGTIRRTQYDGLRKSSTGEGARNFFTIRASV